ncbi:hypothetical protein [Clostridium sp. CCUG 7971]|nr:hypothetical protein [Clostridium sp. CCUG 7971]MBO3444591.1 hypothetical protein [Clostridium sp. CCUG 7971]
MGVVCIFRVRIVLLSILGIRRLEKVLMGTIRLFLGSEVQVRNIVNFK